MGMQESTGALDYARNEYIKVGHSFIFDRVGDMIYYSCLAHYGKDYWVDGTNGLATNSGRSMNGAMKTIAQAITLSNADIVLNPNHNNRINIIGGTYTEDLTGATNCDLIGLDANRRGWSPRIAGTMTVTGTYGMRLFDLQLAAAAAGDEAVILNDACHNFEMHRCELRAAASSTGYGIHMTGSTFYMKIEDCSFTTDWHTGIRIDGNCKQLRIFNNMIGASNCGIYVKAGVTTSFDSLIKSNVITRSTPNSATCLVTGIDLADLVRIPHITIVDNYIAAADAIHFGHSPSQHEDHLRCIHNHIVEGETGNTETDES